MTLLVFTFFLLLASSAFFSGSETALFSLSQVSLQRFRKSHAISAIKVVEALREPRKMLITILLGNELVNVAMSIVGVSIINHIFHMDVELAAILAVAIVTPIVLIGGEIVPKNIALRYAPHLAPIIIWPLSLFYKLARPLRALLTKIADRVIIVMGGRPERTEPMIMEEEFRRLVDLGRREGVIASEEGELIHKVFEFTDKVASDIMTKAQDIFSLPDEMSYEGMTEEIRGVEFSRIPIYRGAPTNVIGILHVRDLFAFHRKRLKGGETNLSEILRETLFVDEATKLEVLLREFQRTQMHMALVNDKSKRLIGLVTMGDVLEELFGEME